MTSTGSVLEDIAQPASTSTSMHYFSCNSLMDNDNETKIYRIIEEYREHGVCAIEKAEQNVGNRGK